MIEVQEPKLSLELEGPHEVFYGKKELYRLKLANKGSGNAENVVIVVTPVGAGDNVSASHKVGLLAAGEEKSLDVELTARQGGLLTIQAEARADGGLHAELAEKVLVRRAGLKLDIAGPKVAIRRRRGHLLHAGPQFGHCAGSEHQSLGRVACRRQVSFGHRRRPLRCGRKQAGVEPGTLAPDVERSFTIKCRLATVARRRCGSTPSPTTTWSRPPRRACKSRPSPI